jgi:hypothetical protein
MTATRPLTLSAAQVIALQSGAVEIRRKVTPQPGSPSYFIGWHGINEATFEAQKTSEITFARSPFGTIGARFWVRERIGRRTCEPSDVMYLADQDRQRYYRWEIEPWDIIDPMPREYARLFPVLTALCVEQIGGVWYWIGTFEQVEK